MNQLPGLAIFGLNSVSKVVISIFQNYGFKIIGIWDTHFDELKDYSESINVSLYTTDEDKILVCKDVEMVCIFCAPHLHSQIATKALSIGKHVICMPPPGLDQNDVKKMVIGAQYYPSLISLMTYSMRYLPAIVQMKKIIDDGILGTITTCEYVIHKSMQFTPDRKDLTKSQEQILVDKKNCTTNKEFYDELIKELQGPIFNFKSQNGIDNKIINALNKEYWKTDPWMGGGILNLLGSHAIDTLNFLINDKILKVHGEVACIKSYATKVPFLNAGRSFDDYVIVNALYKITKVRALFVLNSSLQPELDKENLIINGSLDKLILVVNDGFGQINLGHLQKTFNLDNKAYKNLLFLNKDYHNNERICSLHFDGIKYTVHPSSNNTLSQIQSPSITSQLNGSLNLDSITFQHLPRSYFVSLGRMIGAVRESFTSCSVGLWAKRSLGSSSTFEDALHICNVLTAIHSSSKSKSWITIPSSESFIPDDEPQDQITSNIMIPSSSITNPVAAPYKGSVRTRPMSTYMNTEHVASTFFTTHHQI